MAEVEVCPECTWNCSVIHGKKKKMMMMKKNGLPVLSSFFKVMIGHHFSDLLFIPPKFARTVSTLVNQTVHLEDSSGRQWEVTVSEHDGSYAFLSGWNSFSSDHGLEIGDFLIFFYLGSRFLVKVYDKTGCEKQDHPRSKKRSRSRTTSTAVEGRHKTSESPGHASRNKASTDNQASSGSGASDASAEISHCCSERNGIEEEANDSTPLCPDAQPLPAKGCTEELLCVVDRGIRSMEGEEFGAAFDLSAFEMCKENNHLSDGVSKRCRTLAGNSDKSQTSRDDNTILINSESDACGAETKDTGERSMSIQTEQLPIPWGLIQPMPMQMSAGVNVTAGAVTEEHGLKMRSRLLLHNHDFSGEMSRLDILCDPTRSVSGEESKEDAKQRIDWVEQVGTASNSDAYARGDPSSPSAGDCSCTIKVTAVCGNALDLPGNLPATFFRGGKNKDRRMLFLQDPMQRLWPVVYQENSGCRFLSHGWEGFRNAHNLKPGDDCIFEVRDEAKALFGVCIVRR